MARGDYALKVPEMKEAARLYTEKLWSASQIAYHFGVCPSAVKNALRFQGVQMRDRVEALRLRYATA